MLIDSGDGGSGGEDVGKLTRKRLNSGLPGRKQGTVRIQVVLKEPLGLFPKTLRIISVPYPVHFLFGTFACRFLRKLACRRASILSSSVPTQLTTLL